MQDDFPLMRSKVTVRAILMRRKVASREISIINATKHLSASSVVHADFSACTHKYYCEILFHKLTLDINDIL